MNVGSILNDDPPPQKTNEHQSLQSPSSNVALSAQSPTQISNQQPSSAQATPSSSTARSSSQSVHQRHSITNMLNGPSNNTDAANDDEPKNPVPIPPAPVQHTTSHELIFKKPSSAMSSPSINYRQAPQLNSAFSSAKTSPLASKRNSIANITNDYDEEQEISSTPSAPAVAVTAASPASISLHNVQQLVIKEQSPARVDEQTMKTSNSLVNVNNSKVTSKDDNASDTSNGASSTRVNASIAANASSSASSNANASNGSIPQKVEQESTQQPLTAEEEDDLARIKKIKESRKPRRYSTPPIWAQRWIPPNEQNNQHQFSTLHLQQQQQEGVDDLSGTFSTTKISLKPVFDYSSTRYVDLQCSITGRIPPSSITRTIAEWIYANFANIEDHNRKNVELELKFGKIIDKRTGNRLNLNVTTECIYNDPSNVRFDMEVEEIAWKDVRKLFEELERAYQDEKLKDPQHSGPKRKFNMLESDQTDSFYQIGNKNEQIRKVRVSKDNLLSPPRFTAIQKDRIGDLYIHEPKSMYDLRLSLSLEVPVPEANIESIVSKHSPQMSREKKRTTWTHTPTITQFDLTRVLIPRDFKSKKTNKRVIDHETKYEIEMEIDTLEVFNSIDKIISGTDNFRLEELVEIFLNNSRVINNRVTKLAG